MKLYKLSQGSTFENLKHFIYITNEYGVPSAEFVDAFVDQFGKVILTGNFTDERIPLNLLDILWNEVVEDCKRNKVKYRENNSKLFYNVLFQKAVLKIKEGYEQSDWNKLEETKKLELLRQFIVNFEQYKDEFIDTEVETCEYNDTFKKDSDEGNVETIVEEKNIIITYKKSLQYRQNPIVLYDEANTIELYHSISEDSIPEYKYVIIKTDDKDTIGNEYTDINKLIKDTCIKDITLLKYSNGAPIIDLIKNIK